MADFSSNAGDLIVPIPTSEWGYRPFAVLMWDGEAGAPLATLFAQVALFAVSLCLQKSTLCSKYDHSGIKTAILYHICTVLLCYTKRWSRWSGRGFSRRRCGVEVNLIANFICLILGTLLEKFYEKSLASLCFGLTMTILFLILLVIIRPRTDLGFFGFLVGATGSVAYDLFELKLGTWVVLAICFLPLAFKCWLDKHWLGQGSEEYLKRYSMSAHKSFNPVLGHVIQRIDALMVAGLYLVWAYIILSTNCLNSESCASCSAMEKLKCGAIYGLWLSPAHIHCIHCILKTQMRKVE
ncbi:hypothetical protein SLEP1_g12882 [Rubroshorea leprosula]|uniref:Uncharacterized protein n=1 Tax=Rubroshorea leprosula TaxID=152421 RepID=A0AAV5INQ5_9ROSI|nr:hypothetical protein SLEP1_g12882 [Rubroshorea leprosula]